MTIFEGIRAQVGARDVAELYGLRFGRNGRALCPWHDDHHPDLRFYENGTCHCFACHAGGDAVALTAQLFGIQPIEAARKINSDFHLGLDEDSPQVPLGPSKAEIRRERLEAERQEWGALCEVVQQADKRLATFSAESAWDDPRFVAVLQARSRANNELDNIWEEVISRGRGG